MRELLGIAPHRLMTDRRGRIKEGGIQRGQVKSRTLGVNRPKRA